MRPLTQLNRIRFTTEETTGLKDLAQKMGVSKAALVRAFVRLGLGQTKGAAVAELKTLVRADVVRRGRELGYAKAAREKGSVAA